MSFQHDFLTFCAVDIADQPVGDDHGAFLVNLRDSLTKQLRDNYPEAEVNPYISGIRLVVVADEAIAKTDDSFFVEYDITSGTAELRRTGHAVSERA